MALLRRFIAGRLWRSMPGRLSIWTLSALLLVAGPSARADAPLPAASQLKAVFLFNFAQFLTWPPRAFSDEHAPIVIGVLADEPFALYLEGIVRGEKIGGRPIVVRRYRRAEDISGCHILFVSHSDAADLDRILALLRGKPVLTVGEEETFTRHGGMVAFVTQPNGKIGLRIDNAAAKAAFLTISSRLLAHATLVPEAKD